jgi:hypothetical protein
MMAAKREMQGAWRQGGDNIAASWVVAIVSMAHIQFPMFGAIVPTVMFTFGERGGHSHTDQQHSQPDYPDTSGSQLRPVLESHIDGPSSLVENVPLDVDTMVRGKADLLSAGRDVADPTSHRSAK